MSFGQQHSTAGPRRSAKRLSHGSESVSSRIRLGLVALAVPYSVLAGWLVFAPHSFYSNFPGFGLRWVSPMGPYDQHGFSDFGGALAGLSVAIWSAAYVAERRLVCVALLASLVQGAAHFTYHLLHLNMLSTANDLGNQTALSYFVLLPAVLLMAIHYAPRDGLLNVPSAQQ
jgi:hypothetical protein